MTLLFSRLQKASPWVLLITMISCSNLFQNDNDPANMRRIQAASYSYTESTFDLANSVEVPRVQTRYGTIAGTKISLEVPFGRPLNSLELAISIQGDRHDLPPGAIDWTSSRNVTVYSQSGKSNTYSIEVHYPAVLVTGGAFLQGATFSASKTAEWVSTHPADGPSEGYEDEFPQHQVRLRSFLMAYAPTSQWAYNDFVKATQRPEPTPTANFAATWNWKAWVNGPNPAEHRDFPVIFVTFDDVIEYCNWLSSQCNLLPVYTAINDTSGNRTGWSFDTSSAGWRLPTEAEWEYAARSGTLNEGFLYPGCEKSQLPDYAWFKYNPTADPSRFKDGANLPFQNPTFVSQSGLKRPTSLGLFDMSGNVWQWCWDWYGDYPTATSEVASNPTGVSAPNSLKQRVVRGGSYADSSLLWLRSTNRGTFPSSSTQVKGSNVGFRVVRTVF